ncbi:sporulation protein [Saccharobesus litoralis]|uniref:Sporulation protein n=1 Tax=Saccharobesus litoralis TaxID=2172099 RepID=A0A2S0VXB3_9ALTE|nr:SPOR domain-containing protein [Saccharobesus litoralis]AWB66342.1 sporulation protein [Saccharobesus litoralis]AWB68844.1 sporulation protein [Saccharobesus litoralis]
MAPRDYKNRGRAQPRKKQIEQAPPKSKIKLVIVLIVTLLVTSGFGYMLWAIKAKAPEQQEKNQQTQVQTPQEKPLPKMPEEKWQYIDELKDKEVIVDVPERKKSTRRYQMQCASFKSKQAAEETKARMAFIGVEAMVKNRKGESWYRVVLGPFESKRDTEPVRHKLQRNGFEGCQVWGWNW